MTTPPIDPYSETMQRAHAALIRYPRFKELHREIQSCQFETEVAGEPQCMSLEGVTGAGKTTLVKSYAESFRRVETPEGTIIPVLYVEVPADATIKSMASAILRKLGDPLATRGTRWAMDERAIYFIKTCGVRLVILDDFHHLYDEQTETVLFKVSEWLKVLIKETGVMFLVVGIDGKVEIILRSNSQLSRLFAVRETLAPFAWDAKHPKTMEEFSHFVEYAEKVVELPLPRHIPRMEMLYRLHYATDGVIANIMNLMRRAAFLARQRGKKETELSALGLAFQTRLQNHLPRKENPFATSPKDKFLSPIGTPEVKKPSRKSRREKKPIAVSQVLSTQ